MEFFDKKIRPQDLFVTALNAEELANVLGESAAATQEHNRPSGNEFMDILAELMHENMMRPAYFYEKKMGLKAGDITKFVRLYAGMSFKEWCDEYVMLAAKDLMLQTDYGLDKLAKRISFSGICTFDRWFIRLTGLSPSDWRRTAKEEQAKQERELLLKVKQELRKNALILNRNPKE